MKKFRSVTFFALLLALLTVDTAYSASPSPKLGGHCTRSGISALSLGQVITCSSGTWRLKGGVKIGTNTRIQNVISDPCESVGTYGDFNDIVYVCTRTPSGSQWEIAASIHTSTKMIPQEIDQKTCATIGLVTILNGTSFTCVYTSGSAQWQQTNLAQIATALRKKPIVGTRCPHVTDVTLINGTYYFCSGSGSKSGTWAKLIPSQYPKIIQSSVVAQAAADLASQIAASKRTGHNRVTLTNGGNNGNGTASSGFQTKPSNSVQKPCSQNFNFHWQITNISLVVSNNSQCAGTFRASGYVDCGSGTQHQNVYWEQVFSMPGQSSFNYTASSLFIDAANQCRAAYATIGQQSILNFNGPVSISQIG